jgi:hypothetical protein
MQQTLKIVCVVALLSAASLPARAEVVSMSGGGFALRQIVTTTLSPEVAWRRFVDIAQWWNGDHTYSGKAAALSIDLRAGGCWCEALSDGGGVRHMTVGYLQPGKMISFEGGLGPLRDMGASGALSVSFKPLPEGGGTALTMTYNVVGYSADGLAAMAPLVDQVLAEQFARFAAVR